MKKLKETHKCEYCGEEARFLLKFKHSKKWCCSERKEKCKANIKTWNKGLTKEKDDRVRKNTTNKKNYNKINYHLKNNKEFLKYEYIEEDKDTKKILVKCKLCGKMFIPKGRQIEHRISMIKKEEFHRGIFYCNACKKKLKNKDQYNFYYALVLVKTERTVRKFKSKIKNIELRGIKFGYDLDHKFSINEGFKNNIIPSIISNLKNLEVLPQSKNRKKSKKCSVTLEQLLKEIDEDNLII